MKKLLISSILTFLLISSYAQFLDFGNSGSTPPIVKTVTSTQINAGDSILLAPAPSSGSLIIDKIILHQTTGNAYSAGAETDSTCLWAYVKGVEHKLPYIIEDAFFTETGLSDIIIQPTYAIDPGSPIWIKFSSKFTGGTMGLTITTSFWGAGTPVTLVNGLTQTQVSGIAKDTADALRVELDAIRADIAEIASKLPSYYIAQNGNDTEDGATPLTAWKTVDKVNSSTFVPGDIVAFKSGDTWRETLTVPTSGTEDAYVTFASYGGGERPKLLGSTEVTSWTQADIPGVAANNDLLDENFEGTGYENSWTETVGANSGCTVDEDNADVARPTDGGSQVLKLVKVITPTATAGASAAMTNILFADNKPIAYIDFYVMVNAHGLSSTDMLYLYRGMDDNADMSTLVLLRNLSGAIKFYPEVYSADDYQGAAYPASGSITLDQWYHFQFLYDVTNLTYSCLIDGNQVLSGSITGTPKTGTKRIYLGDASYVKTMTAYFDLMNVSSTNFKGDDIVLPANVWRSSNTVNDPYSLTYDSEIYFKDINDGVHWGHTKKATADDLAADYDWTWTGDHVCIYSTTNPEGKYLGVEVPQRNQVINLNNKNYIAIDGLEVAYGGVNGIGETFPATTLTGLKIKNCEIHHFGIKGLTSGSYSVDMWHSNALVQDCDIHDGGRRNVSINIGTANIALDSIIIERCKLYHGFHTTGLDISNLGVGSINKVVFRNNLVWDELSESIDGVESVSSGAIYCENEGAGTVTNIEIYNDIFKGTMARTITFGGATGGPASSKIWHNTFFGVNPNIAASTEFILIDVGSNADIKNNIFLYNATEPTFACVGTTATAGTVTANYNLYHNTTTERLIIWDGTAYTIAQWADYKTASGQDANSPAPADPLFTSTTDYNLLAGSPALNAGADLNITTDYYGNERDDTPNLGATE